MLKDILGRIFKAQRSPRFYPRRDETHCVGVRRQYPVIYIHYDCCV